MKIAIINLYQLQMSDVLIIIFFFRHASSLNVREIVKLEIEMQFIIFSLEIEEMLFVEIQWSS
jgi:hypothetical protein